MIWKFDFWMYAKGAKHTLKNTHMNQLVTFDQFISSHLGGSEPNPQTIKKSNGEQINYNEIKLHYNYGTPNDPIISDLFFELPMITSTGIRFKEEDAMGTNGPYKKQSHSMMLVFNLSDPKVKGEMQTALNKLDELHARACQIMAPSKGKLKMHDFDPARPGGMFKNPVYWPRDEVTGEKVAGKNPNLWVKLRNYKTHKTLFTDLDGHPIDWKLLHDVDITMVPLIHFEKVYVGAKASLQISLASAIITKIVKVGTETRQMSTIERLKAKYGNDLADSVNAQLAELRMEKQETLHQDFGDFSSGSMHEIPTETMGGSGSTSSQDQASLQDFLSSAPTMSQPTQQVPSQTTTLPKITTLKIN